MLVLSRKVDESIEIDGRIKVIVKKVKGNRVTIGIDAPDDVAIVRSELYDDASSKFANLVDVQSKLVPHSGSSRAEADSFAFAI